MLLESFEGLAIDLDLLKGGMIHYFYYEIDFVQMKRTLVRNSLPPPKAELATFLMSDYPLVPKGLYKW